MSPVPALLGMGMGLGLLLVVAGLVGVPPSPPRPRAMSLAALHRLAARLAAAVLAGVAAFLFTGWFAGALLVGLAASLLPRILGGRGARAATVTRTEAIAAWAEMLRDTMAAAAGIEEAIVSTARVAPGAIRGPVRRLAARLERDRLDPALRAFADELADPTADLVVSALLLAGDRPVRDLGALLSTLATSARAEATMALRVEAGRSRTRTSMRVVTLFTLGFAAGMVVLNRAYLEPYDTAAGQLVLLVVGACFAAALWALHRMSRLPTPARLLPGRPARGRVA